MVKKKTGLGGWDWGRFLVPRLRGYEGWALFLDVDMLWLDRR